MTCSSKIVASQLAARERGSPGPLLIPIMKGPPHDLLDIIIKVVTVSRFRNNLDDSVPVSKLPAVVYLHSARTFSFFIYICAFYYYYQYNLFPLLCSSFPKYFVFKKIFLKFF